VVTVLVIACPHALGLAIPLVTAITTAKAARSGLLIRNRIDFESARRADVVLFDKTGTLTTGKRSILAVKLAQKSELATTDDLLALAAAVETKSEHVLGESIVREANLRALRLPGISDFRSVVLKCSPPTRLHSPFKIWLRLPTQTKRATRLSMW
jgi:Cu2+-exporting ATPase